MPTYDDELTRRQIEHLSKVRMSLIPAVPEQPCAHNACSQCVGTGVKLDGSPCVHMLSCHCPRCTPRCM